MPVTIHSACDTSDVHSQSSPMQAHMAEQKLMIHRGIPACLAELNNVVDAALLALRQRHLLEDGERLGACERALNWRCTARATSVQQLPPAHALLLFCTHVPSRAKRRDAYHTACHMGFARAPAHRCDTQK